ncbi:MAG: hypothetical protein RL514_1632 [Verrucomicrobiota bacterium]|jgi:hypothetical protein
MNTFTAAPLGKPSSVKSLSTGEPTATGTASTPTTVTAVVSVTYAALAVAKLWTGDWLKKSAGGVSGFDVNVSEMPLR